MHSSYIQTKYNGKEEIINNIFSAYDGDLLNDINHPALVQEWKLNIEHIDANITRPSDKKEIDHNYSKTYWPISKK